MRELKFRAWGKNIKEYLSQDGVEPYAYTLKDISDGLIYDIDGFIIEQCTGIKDKNGKEIYDGDVIREKWYDSVVHMGRDRIGEIEYFCDGFVCWFRGSAFVGLGMFPTKNIEVIGNIHENPELLKKEK